MNKITAFLALTTLAAAGLALGLWVSQPQDSSRRVAELETKLREAEATIARLTKEQRSAKMSASQSLSPGSVAMTPSQQAISGGAPMNPLGSAAGKPLAQQPANAVGAAPSSSPQDAKVRRSLAEAEARYSDLISQFQLSPEEKEVFKQIAAQRSDIRKQATTKLQDPSLTPAQRQSILQAAKNELDQSDGSMRQFLNNDGDFSKFVGWEQTEIERNQMEAGRAIFENNGVSLSTDQEDWLVNSAYALRHDAKGVADPYNLESLVGTRVDQGYVQNVLQKFDRDTQVLLQNARSRFNQPQIEAINAWRTQQRVQVESRLWNMSRTTGTAQ